jgi:hypothetical protein
MGKWLRDWLGFVTLASVIGSVRAMRGQVRTYVSVWQTEPGRNNQGLQAIERRPYMYSAMSTMNIHTPPRANRQISPGHSPPYL